MNRKDYKAIAEEIKEVLRTYEENLSATPDDNKSWARGAIHQIAWKLADHFEKEEGFNKEQFLNDCGITELTGEELQQLKQAIEGIK